MKPVSSRRREAGFSIVEGIGYLVIFGILMGALTYGMGALFRTQAHPEVSYNGQTYAQAPSFGDFQQAINLHAAFSAAVDQADNVVVIGGARSHPAFDPTGPSAALGSGFTDLTSNLTLAEPDPFRGYSSWDLVQDNPAIGVNLTTHPDPADFTVLTVQGLTRVTSITQQRRYTATIDGQNLTLYEVTHQAVDWSTGNPTLVPNADTGAPPTWSYRFYYGPGEDSWALAPGATHYWYRADSTWERDQEGPTRVVFADPYALAGQDPGSVMAPVSRFAYFLPQLQ